MRHMELQAQTLSYSNSLIDIAVSTPAENLGKICNDLSRYYRAIGLYDLLLHLDPPRAFYGLISSALTRLHLLRGLIRSGVSDDPEQIASFIGPFFDAVASDQPKLALEIASVSPSHWMELYEYPDDFAYARFCFSCLPLDNPDVGAGDSALEMFTDALEGHSDSRFDMASALHTRDEESFHEAFALFLEETRSWYDIRSEDQEYASQAYEYDFEANRWICVEGLAWIRFAKARGFTMEDEYLSCPRELMRNDTTFVPDSYPNLPLP